MMISFFSELSAAFLELPSSAQLAVVFLFAALVGSFLNVVIYRLPIIMEREWKAEAREILGLPAKEEPVFTLTVPRSRCRDCGRMITAIENIPIISYLAMRGKCRGCGAPISIFYPLIEFLTAALATFVFWYFGANAQGVAAVFFIFFLVALVGIDFKTQLLPDLLTLSLLWFGLFLSLFNVFISSKTAIIGALIGYLSLYFVGMLFKLVFKKDGLGMGDAKLLAALLTWVPWTMLPVILLIACFVGLLLTALVRLSKRQALMDNPLPFGPYLALGGLLALLFGQPLLRAYLGLFI